ncbi:hypothetical protein Fcan01_21365 [Folsomia candida]|uniref:Uncharacterized protein n=1 Tax=Folsomia candida TaxID=158441 RepID=A0A226DFT8_FOLCA|nr:hypothetical protein Fcan01_21365 [Folsomia candida]
MDQEEDPNGGSGGRGDAPEQEVLLNKLINNTIGENICKHLSLADMKVVCLSTKGMYDMVRNSQAFAEKATLLICKETVLLDKFLVETCEYPWKGLDIDVTIPPTVVDLIMDVLPFVTRLYLRLARTDKVEGKDLTRFVTTLLANTKALKFLQLESVFLEQVLHDILSDASVQETLLKLKTLEICTGNKKNDATYYLDYDEGEDQPFPRNFYQLSCIAFKLTSLSLGKMCTVNGTETDHVKFIPAIIGSTSETLLELSVHMCEVWKLESMQVIHCPKLKRLSVTAYGVDGEAVAAFISHQPHLEHLWISMKETFSLKLLTVVQGRGTKLKSLHFTIKTFPHRPISYLVGAAGAAGDQPAAAPPIQWDFLSNSITSLKDFSICRPYSENEVDELGISRHRIEGTGVSFLKALPPSISKLGLRGLGDFWFDVQEDRVLDNDEDKIAILSRFTNLTELSWTRCGDSSLNDHLVHFILGHCTQLRKLELSYAFALTNAAITGEDENGVVVGVSLKNLNGLVHLSIKGCNITPRGILAAVGHPYLRSLEYLGSLALSTDDLKKIVEQNPSLESVAVHVSGLEDPHELKRELKLVNHRIRKLVDLGGEDGDQDSNSDADEPRQWGGSDISGGPPDYDDFFGVDDDYDYDDDYDEDELDYV